MLNFLIAILLGSSCPSYANISKASDKENPVTQGVNALVDPDPETGGDNGKLPPPKSPRD